VTGGSPQGPWLLRLLGSALAAGLIAVGLASCALSVGAVQHRSSSYTVRGQVSTLVVTDPAGNVHVTGGNSGTISVTERISYHGTAPTTTHRTAAGTLSLVSHCPAAETCGIDYTIAVPRMTTVRVNDGAGAVTVASLGGSVTAHVNAGKISLSSLAGPVEATTHAGSISGQHLSSATASLHVSAGKIDVAFTTPPAAITATTDVGAIALRVPGSVQYKVTAGATVGDVHISVSRSATATRTITASTKTGSITIEPSA
jgi:hypothetical protein